MQSNWLYPINREISEQKNYYYKTYTSVSQKLQLDNLQLYSFQEDISQITIRSSWMDAL